MLGNIYKTLKENDTQKKRKEMEELAKKRTLRKTDDKSRRTDIITEKYNNVLFGNSQP